MKCSCPKCSAILPEDLASVPEKGRKSKCPACGQHYWAHRESFSLRAYYADGQRYCVRCGEDILAEYHCPGCGTLCPEYCIVQLKKPVRRKAAASGFAWDISSGGARKPRGTAVTSSDTVTPARTGGLSAFSINPLVVKALVALVVVAALAAAASLLVGRKGERDFPQKYVFALYLVKAGCEQNLKMSTLLAGGTRLGEKELAELSNAKAHIDSAMQKLNPAPNDYAASYERLQALYQIYGKFFTLCSTSGPSPQVGESAKQLDEEFNRAARGLKSSMPPDLVEALKGAIPKYRNLNFLME